MKSSRIVSFRTYKLWSNYCSDVCKSINKNYDNMKAIYLSLIFSFLTITTYSQDKVKAKEVGITFRNVNVFGLTYRVGNEKALWRFTVLNLGGSNSENFNSNTRYSSWGGGWQIGREYRKELTEKMQFRYGLDLFANYSMNKTKQNIQLGPSQETENETYSGGIGIVLGLNYLINESFLVGVEVLPSVTYQENYSTFTGGTSSTNTGFNYGLSNEPVTLSIIYRF